MKRFLLWLWHFFDSPIRKPRMPKLSDGYLGPKAFNEEMRRQLKARTDRG